MPIPIRTLHAFRRRRPQRTPKILRPRARPRRAHPRHRTNPHVPFQPRQHHLPRPRGRHAPLPRHHPPPFPDLDTILSELITRHLRAIGNEFAKIPHNHPNRQAAERAAYFTATRNGFGCAPTEAHTLLIRERHTLPPDLLTHIEDLREQLGAGLARGHSETALTLLDNCFLRLPQQA